MENLAPFVHHIGIQAMPHGDGGQGLARLAGFSKNL